MNPTDVVILKGKLAELRKAAHSLKTAGVPSEIIRPDTCEVNS